MAAIKYLDAVASWVKEKLEAIEEKPRKAASKLTEKKLAELAAGYPPMAKLLERFKLAPAERQAIELCLGAEVSLEVAQMVRRLTGRRGVTVELGRALYGAQFDALLVAGGALRAHGLLSLDGIPGGLPAATTLICLGPGLAARLCNEEFLPSALGLGIAWIAPGDDASSLPEPLALLLRDDLLDAKSRWVSIGGAQAGDALALAKALAKRIRRGVIVLHGNDISALPTRELWSLVAALRRESDFRDAPIIIDGADSLGGAWRALAAPPPSRRNTPTPIILLCSATAHPGRPDQGFAVREVNFVAPPTPKVSPVVETAPAAPAPEPESDGFEEVRRQAALDAARAMGRSVDISRLTTASNTVTRAPAAAPVTPPTPAAPSTTPSPAPATALAPDMVNVIQPPETKKEKENTTVAPDPAEKLPFIEVPADAPLKDLLKLVGQAQNPLQKADLLRRLVAEGSKNVQVATLLRMHTKADNPTLRQAAEDGMIVMFGPNWSKPRAIPKPVQPPHSDDDRGPPGG